MTDETTTPDPVDEAAAWLVKNGFPLNFTLRQPPPASLARAVERYLLSDPEGNLLGGEYTDLEQVQMFIMNEDPTWPR